MESDERTHGLQAQGWSVITDAGFIGLIGPFYSKAVPGGLALCFPTDSRHHNLRGVLQGGALMTFADRAMGMAARAATGATRTATVQMNMQFIDAVQIGEVVETTPMMLRATRQLMFMEAKLMTGDRIAGSATGIFKRLAEPAA